MSSRREKNEESIRSKFEAKLAKQREVDSDAVPFRYRLILLFCTWVIGLGLAGGMNPSSVDMLPYFPYGLLSGSAFLGQKAATVWVVSAYAVYPLLSTILLLTKRRILIIVAYTILLGFLIPNVIGCGLYGLVLVWRPTIAKN